MVRENASSGTETDDDLFERVRALAMGIK
jgi:hypothetical protein